jgi:RNA ligase (TIGR02306 family)
MSSFAVPVLLLDDVVPHPNADLLDMASIGDFRAIVPKGQFKKGDRAVYVPEGAVVPEWVLEKEGLVGKLAGAAKNRVKAIRLRFLF